MKILLAGCEPLKYREIFQKVGIENALQSFWFLGQGKQAPAQDEFKFYLLDSGGYSARVRGVEIDVKDYARYLNKYKVKFAFNLDVSDNEKSLENFYYLNENTNTYIIPIYHGPEWRDPEWRDIIDYYVENFPFIGLGGIAGGETNKEDTKRFLNYVFKRTKDKVMVHGLGTTREDLMSQYPFFCVDSTSWQSMSRFANSNVHSKEMAKVRARKKHYLVNSIDELHYWKELEAKMTRLWKMRGIDWGDLDHEEIMKKRNITRYKKKT